MLFKNIKDNTPYQAIAFIYTEVMRHVDYVMWGDYIEEVFQHYDHEPEHVLEMACGVGTLAAYLADKGYHIHAVDNSELMIKLAKETNTSPRVDFEVGDMRTYRSEQKFDTILCLYDSINYMEDQEQLEQALAALGKCLKPNGLMIFDITTEYNSLTYFNNKQETEEAADFLYWRRSKYTRRDRLQTNEFTIFLKDGELYRRYYEKHDQRIFSHAAVKRAIKNSGLQWIGHFHEFSLDLPIKESLRIHFVVRRSE